MINNKIREQRSIRNIIIFKENEGLVAQVNYSGSYPSYSVKTKYMPCFENGDTVTLDFTNDFPDDIHS